MVTLYVFSLVLGGGLLGLSLLGDIFGGHDVDLASGTSMDMGGDTDLGFDAHMDVDVHVDAAGGAAGHAAHGDHASSKIFSIRTATYALFGFGAVGASLTYVFHASSTALTAVFAIAGGLLAGTLVNVAFGWLRRSESGAVQREEALAGHTGRVALPLSGSAGRILVEVSGRTVRLRALPHPSALGQGDPEGWTSVVVVEMKDGVALVAPVAKDLLGG